MILQDTADHVSEAATGRSPQGRELPMHICFLCNEYPPASHGGIGSFTQTMARALARRGHRVTVAGLYLDAPAGEWDDQGVRVIQIAPSPLPKTGFLVNGRRLRRELQRIHRQHPIDVLEGPEASLAMIDRKFPAAKIIRMHGGHRFFAVTLGRKPRAWRSWLEKRSFGRADYLCAVSRFVAVKTGELLSLGDRPVEVLPNPTELADLEDFPEVAEEEDRILFVGTVCEKKGARELVQAMPLILDAIPNAKLWIVGRDSCDPQTGESFIEGLRKEVSADVLEQIEFCGAVPREQIPNLLARATVCTYPSHMESQGIVIIEAMSMGKALVANATGPGPEIVDDGVTGLLCDPHDPKSIADAVVRLLSDSALRHRLGQQARKQARSHYSLDVITAQNEKFYRGCVKDYRASH